MFSAILQTCQISSRMCRKLISTNGLLDQPSKLLDLVNQLNQDLQNWKDALPSHIRPQDKVMSCPITLNTTNLAIILLHCSYYDLIMALHGTFAYPWALKDPAQESDLPLRARLRAQIRTSCELVATAARNIIVMARSFDLNGACTHAYVLPSRLTMVPSLNFFHR